MPYFLDNLISLVALTAVFYAPGYLGRGLLRRVSPEADDVVGRLALGMASWCYLTFTLGALRLLYAEVLASLAVGLGAAAAVVYLRERRRSGPPAPAEPRRFDWIAVALGLVIAVLLGERLLRAMVPFLEWDTSHYHLTVPRIWLDHGGFRALPFNMSSDLPFNIEMLFTVALALRGFVAAKLVHFLLGALLLLAVYRFCARSTPRWAAALAALLVLGNAVVLFEYRTAYNELGLSLFLFVAFRFLVDALEGRGNVRTGILFSGLFLGCAAGSKLGIGAYGVVALLVAFAVDGLRAGSPLRQIAGRGVVLISCALLLLAPWLAKSFVFNGNPVYPLMYGWFGGPHWSVELGEAMRADLFSHGMGRAWSDYLLLPYRVIANGRMEGFDGFHGHLTPVWLGLIPLALLFGRGSRWGRFCLVLGGVYFGLWSMGLQQLRYLVPALPFFAVAAAVALGPVAERVSKRLARGALVGVVALAVSGFAVAELGHTYPRSMPASVYLESAGAVLARAVPPVFGVINAELPDDALLMFLNTNQGFFCEREYIADNSFEASQINALLLPAETPADIARLLDELGVTHVLFYSRYWRIPYPESFNMYLADPAAVRVVYRSAEYVLLERLGRTRDHQRSRP